MYGRKQSVHDALLLSRPENLPKRPKFVERASLRNPPRPEKGYERPSLGYEIQVNINVNKVEENGMMDIEREDHCEEFGGQMEGEGVQREIGFYEGGNGKFGFFGEDGGGVFFDEEKLLRFSKKASEEFLGVLEKDPMVSFLKGHLERPGVDEMIGYVLGEGGMKSAFDLPKSSEIL